MERALVAVALALVALGVAWFLQRRQRPDAPTRAGYAVPQQLDRDDFDRPDAPWLVTVFTSATCGTCARAWAQVEPLASARVAVQELEHTAERTLHDRYGIEAVPTTLVVDDRGVVRASYVGDVTAAQLILALAGGAAG